MEQTRGLVLGIARALVDDPGSVKENVVGGSNSYVFELSVARSDLGKVIGKQGKTADAMRHILGAVAAKLKKRCVLEIIE